MKAHVIETLDTTVLKPCTKNCDKLNTLKNKSNVLKMYSERRPKNCNRLSKKYAE